MNNPGICPSCQSQVRPEDDFCGSCGNKLAKAASESSGSAAQPVTNLPIRLEVKLGRQFKLGTHGNLDFRVVNQTRNDIPNVELGIESRLTLHEGTEFSFDVPAGQDVPHFVTFIAAYEGQHYFSFRFEVNRSDVFVGRFPIEVLSDSSNTQIINFTDARRIEGRVVVGTEGTKLSLAPRVEKPIATDEFVEVLLRRPPKITTSHGKRPLAGFEHARYQSERLSLHVRRNKELVSICLLAKESSVMGRQRHGADIVTRVYLPGGEICNDNERVSRIHAAVTFTNDGATFQDKSKYGSQLGNRRLSLGECCLLPQRTEICLADVFRLTCELFYGDGVEILASYRRFADRHIGMAVAEPVGRLRAVRLKRLDELADTEEYVMFQHVVTIGSGPLCEVQLDDDSVCPQHAQIVWLGDSMWIEPLQTIRPTLVDGQVIPRNRLVPLRPNLHLQFGDVEVSVSDFRQRYLDS